jgi:iron-sulfur cluster assembly protein
MTVLETTTQIQAITLTAPAAEAVKELLAKRDLVDYSLRVFIQGGGCSGFQYGMALDNRVLENDTIIEAHGVKVLVDEMSLNYLKGATVDYVDEIMGSGFKITNPNAVSTCGCGQSFRSSESSQDSEEGCGSGCGCH